MSDRVLVMREGRQMGVFAGRRPRAGADHDCRGRCAVITESDVVAVAAPAPRPRRRDCARSGSRACRSSPCSRSTVVLFTLVVDDYLSARFVSRLLIAISITAVLAAGESRRDHHPQHRPVRRVDRRRLRLPDGRAARRQRRTARRRWRSPSPSASAPCSVSSTACSSPSPRCRRSSSRSARCRSTAAC